MGDSAEVDLEMVACPLCGEARDRPFLKVRDREWGAAGEFQLVRCAGCGLVYLNPRPTRATIHHCYPSTYFSSCPREWVSWGSGSPRIAGFVLWRAYGWAFARGGERVLDVGCGKGEGLEFLRAAGKEVWGVDVSPEAVQEARDRGLKVVEGDLEGAKFPDGFFDGVVLSHSLEHIHDPVGLLREVRRILKPGGSCFVEVPNIESPWFFLTRDRWHPLQVPLHLCHFSPATLGRALERAGFRVERLRRPPKGTLHDNLDFAVDRRLSPLLRRVRALPLAFLLFDILFEILFPLKGDVLVAQGVKES